eukprot:50096-Eustigmatos_ZCMA.PRE.1
MAECDDLNNNTRSCRGGSLTACHSETNTVSVSTKWVYEPVPLWLCHMARCVDTCSCEKGDG